MRKIKRAPVQVVDRFEKRLPSRFGAICLQKSIHSLNDRLSILD